MLLICCNIKSGRNENMSLKKTKIKPFMNENNWEGINLHLEKDDSKKIEKDNRKLLWIFGMLKKKKYILFMFQNITQIMKNKLFF